MAALTVNGRRIRVHDSFKSLNRAEQEAAVEEISAQMDSAGPAEEPKTGVYNNATAGLNETIYATAGAPVGAARSVINALTQPEEEAGPDAPRSFIPSPEDAIRNLVSSFGIPEIPDNTVGSAKWISDQFERAGVNDPDNVEPANDLERIARATGSGIGMTVAPEMAVAGLASRAGTMAPRLLEGLKGLFGPGNTAGGMARNAVIGGASNAGADMAAETDLVPDWLKPTVAVVGGLAGGGLAAAVSEIPKGVSVLASALRAAGEANTTEGRQQIVGRTLVKNANDAGKVIEDLDSVTDDMVPGSMPTTFQQTGDMGLGGLERIARTRDPAAFLQRAAEQNTARVAEIEAIQTTGAPEAVAKSVRRHVQQLEQQAQRKIAEATVRAQQSAEGVGRGKSPDEVGQSVRAALERQRTAAVEQERALWEAIDPDGSLALPVPNSVATLQTTIKSLPKSAKPPVGEEAAIYQAVSRYRGVESFSEVNALRTRLAEAMRDEMERHGRTTAHARMATLNTALWKDIEGAVTSKIAQDVDAVAAGQMGPEEAATARLGSVSAPSTGNAAFTPSGRRVDVDYQIIEADDAITSQLDDMRPNPAYDAALQPRNRDRAASELQIAKIAGELQPERLGPSATAGEGAPIIGPDGMVESGNGRVLALRRAYQQGGQPADNYRRYLQGEGYDTAGFEHPILVRRNRTQMAPADRARFAQEANASQALAMSASERAASDASRLTDDVIGLYRGGDINSAENRDFVRSFLKTVADQGEEGAFTTRDGAISLDGVQRVRGALLAAAYDDTTLIEALADAGDENVQAFGKALYDLAGDVARLKRKVAAREIDASNDLSAPLVDSARLVQQARKTRSRLSDIANQQDAFSAANADALDILRFAYGDNLDQRFSRIHFDKALKSVISEAELQTTEARLFGEPTQLVDILQGALLRYGTNSRKSSGRGSVEDYRAGDGAAGPRARGPSDGSPGPRGAGSGAANRSVLEGRSEPELKPNFAEAAYRRLTGARDASQARVNTFDNRTLGPLIRRPSEASNYSIAESTVPGRLFYEGPGSVDAIRAYRRAVGPERAGADVRNFAAERLRKEAMREDMTLDPQKLIMFRRRYQDPLSEFPNLNAQLANAQKASTMLDEVAREQRLAIDDAQKGVLGRLFGLDDPEDVVRTVGAIFRRQDAVAQMRRVRQTIGDDKEAVEGLRKSIVDHLMTQMIGNTEAATSGVGTVKADAFQSFVRQNKAALYEAGFNETDVLRFERLAADVQRANRSISSVKLPGQSNTAQDVLALATQENELTSLLLNMAAAPVAGGVGSWLLGPVGAFVGVLGTNAVAQMQAKGLATVHDLLGEALLDPQLASALIKRVKPRELPSARVGFKTALGGAQARTAMLSAREEDRSSIPALVRKVLMGK